MQVHIENMTCGGCLRGVTRAIQSVDPGAEVEARLDRHEVQVKTDAPRETLVRALAAAGFQAT